MAVRYPEVRLIQLSEKGRGRALKQAWLQSSADILAYMDIDLSTNLDSFVPMITPLIMGEAAVATGSRLMKQSRTTRGFKRDTISRCYNWIIRRTMKTKFVDAQCGFKAIRRDAARKILPRIKDTGWFFDTELLVKAEYAGYTIHEEPVFELALYYSLISTNAKPTCGALPGQRGASHDKTVAVAQYRSR